MLAGAHNPTEIAEWAKNLDTELLGRLHVRRSPQSGLLVAPSLSTIQRVLWAVERDQLDAVVHEVVARQLGARRARIEVPADAPEDAPAEEDTDDDDPPAASATQMVRVSSRPWPLAVSVIGADHRSSSSPAIAS